MERGVVSKLLATFVMGLMAAATQAATIWNETTNGDFSNNGLSPTPLSLAIGNSSVQGSMGNSGSGVDRDYFSITVPPGAKLATVKLLDTTFVSGGVSFIAMQAGPAITIPPTASSSQASAVLMGYTHYDNAFVGLDLLSSMVFPAYGPPPLASGTYAFWVQETGGPATFGLEFEVIPGPGGPTASVPTLPEWGMILLATLIAFTAWRQRNRRPSV